MKKTIITLLLVITGMLSFGQKAHRPNPYKFALGMGYYPTLDEPFTVDFKLYTRPGYSFEFIGYNLRKSWRLTTLFNFYTPISADGKFRLVVGPGVHLGLWKEGYKINSWSTNPIVGIDGIIGLEYRIPKTPINLQIHYQPSYDLAGNSEVHYEADWAGAVIRIAF